MRHLPLFASLHGRACLIVGGGVVAERRARLLREAGARVTLRAPAFSSALERLAADDSAVILERRPFADEDVGPFWLVVAATDDPAVNARVAAAADRARVFCNVVDDAERSSFIMPAIVDRDPVTIAISSGGLSPVVARYVKGLIESLVPSRLGALARLAGRWRARVRAAIPDADERRHFWQDLVEGPAAEHAFAGRDEEAERVLQRSLAERTAVRARDRAVADQKAGEAWLVGAGPGHPDLITLRGRQLLAAADVVLYDRLGAPGLLRYARRDAELIPVGKTPGRPSITQAEINRLLVELVAAGKRVCRLKGGDPMVFGRAGEELEALVEAGLPFQIVPGVSAVEGCAAYAGIPLTLRNVSRALLITTGHENNDESSELASFKPGQTLALYMGVAHYAGIAADLIRLGHDPDTPATIVEKGTTDAQRVIRTVLRLLPDAAAHFAISPPALLVVGETARLAERFAWFAPGTVHVYDDRAAHAVSRVS